MEEKYKGWTIIYDEKGETFVATDSNENKIKSNKLKNLKKKIDNFKFKRIPVIYSHYDQEIFLGEITSIVDEGEDWRSPTVWVSYTDKKGYKTRAKCSVSYSLYKVTDDNAAIFNKITVLRDKIKELEKQIDGLREKLDLEKITRKDLGLEEKKD